MIKVITSFVSCLAAILLGILALATDFWLVWWKEAKEIGGVQYHHEGLFQTCSESSINNTVVAADSCTKLHDLGRPGTSFSDLVVCRRKNICVSCLHLLCSLPDWLLGLLVDSQLDKYLCKIKLTLQTNFCQWQISINVEFRDWLRLETLTHTNYNQLFWIIILIMNSSYTYFKGFWVFVTIFVLHVSNFS